MKDTVLLYKVNRLPGVGLVTDASESQGSLVCRKKFLELLVGENIVESNAVMRHAPKSVIRRSASRGGSQSKEKGAHSNGP